MFIFILHSSLSFKIIKNHTWKMSLSIEFESWVSTQNSDSKLTENELLNSILKPKTHLKWVTRLKLRLKLRLKTHRKWISQLKTQTQNSLKMRLKLNTQTHFFFEFPCMLKIRMCPLLKLNENEAWTFMMVQFC